MQQDLTRMTEGIWQTLSRSQCERKLDERLSLYCVVCMSSPEGLHLYGVSDSLPGVSMRHLLWDRISS
jgi:hypothetical protein